MYLERNKNLILITLVSSKKVILHPPPSAHYQKNYNNSRNNKVQLIKLIFLSVLQMLLWSGPDQLMIPSYWPIPLYLNWWKLWVDPGFWEIQDIPWRNGCWPHSMNQEAPKKKITIKPTAQPETQWKGHLGFLSAGSGLFIIFCILGWITVIKNKIHFGIHPWHVNYN